MSAEFERDWDPKFDWRLGPSFGVSFVPPGWSLEKIIWWAARQDCTDIWDAKHGGGYGVGSCTVGMMIEHWARTFVGRVPGDDPRKLELAAHYRAAHAHWWQLHLVKVHWEPFGDTGPLAPLWGPKIAPVPEERWDRYFAACRAFDRFWWPGQGAEVLETACTYCGDTMMLRGAQAAFPHAARCVACGGDDLYWRELAS